MKKFVIKADIRVKEDLKESKDFFESRRKGLGNKFINEYRELLASLKINPFYEVRYNEVRCLPFKIFPLMIHFKIDEELQIVSVIAVISTHQNPDDKWAW